MKKLSILAAAAAFAATTAAPVVAQEVTVDPFVSTMSHTAGSGLGIVAGVFTIIAIAAASGSN